MAEATPPTVEDAMVWMGRLLPRLAKQRERADALDVYYRCEQMLPPSSSKVVRDAYRRLMRMSGSSWAELIAEAVRERMIPEGFRAPGSIELDQAAQRIWQANCLDAESMLVHQAQVVMADGYVIVGPGADGELPVITGEDPREVVTIHDPARRRNTVAALKVFHDDVDQLDKAYVYLPGCVVQFFRKSKNRGPDKTPKLTSSDWKPVGPPAPTGYGGVPVFRFANRPQLDGSSVGEFENNLPHLDRIQYQVLSRLETATLQAFRQRAIKGVDGVDQNGEEIDYSDVFAADPGAMWTLPDTAEIWESGQLDLGPILKAVSDDIQHLAAVTRTPMHYFSPDNASGSAEGASLAREGLIFKVQDRLVTTGESWEAVMSCALELAGEGAQPELETVWRDPERFSLAERADAAVKAKAAGVPWRSTMELMGFSPLEIDRMDAERKAEALDAAAFGVLTAPPPSSVVPGA